MREQYIETGDGFLLVYSVIDPCSTTSLTNIQEQILSVKRQKDKIIPEIPLVLVGNKVRNLSVFFFLMKLSTYVYLCICYRLKLNSGPFKSNWVKINQTR